MLAPLSWIRDFAPVTAPVPEIVSALNQLGLEVEAVEEPGREISGVVAARILDVLPHPNADKIRLADIDFGSGQTARRVRGPEHHRGHGGAVRAVRCDAARRLHARTAHHPRRGVRRHAAVGA